MLTRLLPFVEKRINLIELAPKGTGKSYVFGHISKNGLLTDGGKVTRSKMFYDANRRKPGYICGPDYVAIDEVKLVNLRCDNSLMKTMVDRFGEDVTTLAYDMTSFRVQTEVSASPTFFGWVFGFNGKVQILAPESVKEQYRQMIAKADEDMQESE